MNGTHYHYKRRPMGSVEFLLCLVIGVPFAIWMTIAFFGWIAAGFWICAALFLGYEIHRVASIVRKSHIGGDKVSSSSRGDP